MSIWATILSLIYSRYLNNTWIYNASSPFCPEEKTDEACKTYRGGLYDPDASSSARAVADVYAAGGSPSDTDRTEGLHIWDSSWTLDDLSAGNTTLEGFPIGSPGLIWRTGSPTGCSWPGPELYTAVNSQECRLHKLKILWILVGSKRGHFERSDGRIYYSRRVRYREDTRTQHHVSH